MTITKEDIMRMAADDVQQLLYIISDLTYVGYKVSMCKLKGYSYQQCAIKFGITKSHAQKYIIKCNRNGYDVILKRMFNIN